MIKKVILWGHKFNRYNTFSHIHSSYHKAFNAMGYESHWLWEEDLPAIKDAAFSNTLFFTEGQVDKNIPLIKEAFYVLHHCNNDKYLNAGCKILNLCNYLKYCEEGISFNYKDTGNTVEKIKDLTFYDDKAKALYQPWATDLLPEEINENDFCRYDSEKKVVNYVGTIWNENIKEITPFAKACEDNGIEFKSYRGGLSDQDNKKLVRDSYIAPDLRGDWHKECGYLPCRIFKNISYGQTTGTNSPHVYNVFGDMIAYDPNPYKLFRVCEEFSMKATENEIKKSILFVKEKHTYINRIENILNIIEEWE